MENRKFIRSKNQALLGGVASGLALSYGWSVALTRIFLILLNGFGVVFYIVAWFLAPLESEANPLPEAGQDTLMRSNDGKMLAGVCAGIANSTGVDVTLIRVALVVSILFVGAGVFPYLLAWILIPVARQNNVALDR